MMPLSEENILLGLIQQQRLKVISASQQQLRLSTEIQSLAQLKSRSEGFLNAYDQLFRYISIWLLIRGYASESTSTTVRKISKGCKSNELPINFQGRCIC